MVSSLVHLFGSIRSPSEDTKIISLTSSLYKHILDPQAHSPTQDCLPKALDYEIHPDILSLALTS